MRPPVRAERACRRACRGRGAVRVKRIVKVVVFVASTPDFTAQPKVANGVSELLGEVFGEAGRHARSAVGVSVLPLDAPVEVELVVEVSVRRITVPGFVQVPICSDSSGADRARRTRDTHLARRSRAARRRAGSPQRASGGTTSRCTRRPRRLGASSGAGRAREERQEEAGSYDEDVCAGAAAAIASRTAAAAAVAVMGTP